MRDGWEIKKLGDITSIKSGKSIEADLISTDASLYTCYGVNGIRGFVDSFSYDGCYLIIGRVGALCGNIHLAKGKFYATEHALVVEIKDAGTYSEWLKYNLISLNLRSIAKGVAQPVISAGEVSKITISVPSLSEQERIVAELDCLSSIIEKQKQQLKEYDTLAQSIFYDMFGDPITNEKGWEVKKWEDILTIINGKNQRAVENPEGEYPIYGSGGIMGYADEYLCPKDTVIIGRKGNINKPIYVREPFWNVDTAFGLVADNISLAADYLYFFCVIYDFEQLNKAVTIPSLTKVDLLKINTPVPPLALQQEFASKIEAIEKQKAILKQSIEDAELLFNSRMDYYFN